MANLFLLNSAILSAGSQGQRENLAARVFSGDQPGITLDKRIETASFEFLKITREGFYFMAYSFPASRESHAASGFNRRSYKGRPEKGRIHFSSFLTERRGRPNNIHSQKLTVLVLFHQVSGQEARVLDISLLEENNYYQFDDAPCFWLGEVSARESFNFFKSRFLLAEDSLRRKLVFVISLHDHPEVYDFLYHTASGDYELRVREAAIFWLGNLRNAKSLALLKKLCPKEMSDQLKKQIIFALQLSDGEEAIKELIHIAREEKEMDGRRTAIFWLGQKATKECVEALKDIVVDDNELEIKGQAIFAISQLPKEKAVPGLISICRENNSPAVGKKAIFWLAQVGEAEAVKFFEEILLKKR